MRDDAGGGESEEGEGTEEGGDVGVGEGWRGLVRLARRRIWKSAWAKMVSTVGR